MTEGAICSRAASSHLCRWREYIFAFLSRTSWDFSEVASVLSILRLDSDVWSTETAAAFSWKGCCRSCGWESTDPGFFTGRRGKSSCLLLTVHRDAEDFFSFFFYLFWMLFSLEAEAAVTSDDHCSCCCRCSNITAASSKEADPSCSMHEWEEPQDEKKKKTNSFWLRDWSSSRDGCFSPQVLWNKKYRLKYFLSARCGIIIIMNNNNNKFNQASPMNNLF